MEMEADLVRLSIQSWWTFREKALDFFKLPKLSPRIILSYQARPSCLLDGSNYFPRIYL